MPALGLAANGFGPNPFAFAWTITYAGLVDPALIWVCLVAVLLCFIVCLGRPGSRSGLGFIAFGLHVAVELVDDVKHGP